MVQKKYKQINSAGVPELLSRGAAIVDVRRQEEWQSTGVVEGSFLLTFFDEERNSHPEEWLRQLDQLVPADQPLLLI